MYEEAAKTIAELVSLMRKSKNRPPVSEHKVQAVSLSLGIIIIALLQNRTNSKVCLKHAEMNEFGQRNNA